MHIRVPYAQIRDDGEFSVRLNAAGKAPFAVIDLSGDGATALTMNLVDDCDRLSRAIARARSLLLSETSESVRRALDPERDDWDGEQLASHTGEPVADGRWCSSKRVAGMAGGQWQCTLPGGHEGRHEARGTFPLPNWLDSNTHAVYDASGDDGTAGTDAP